MNNKAEQSEDSVIEKVRKLLALAEHPNTPPEEAQTAGARAAMLMARHELKEAVIRQEAGSAPEPVELMRFVIEGTNGLGRERTSAIAAIAVAHGAKVAAEGNNSTSDPRTLLIVATKSTNDALLLLLASIVLQMENAGKKEAKAHLAEMARYLSSNGRQAERRTFLRSFYLSYGEAVAKKITAMQQEMTEEVAGTTGALVLVGNAERIAVEFKQLFPALGKPRQRRAAGSVAGHMAGSRQGSRANLGSSELH